MWFLGWLAIMILWWCSGLFGLWLLQRIGHGFNYYVRRRSVWMLLWLGPFLVLIAAVIAVVEATGKNKSKG